MNNDISRGDLEKLHDPDSFSGAFAAYDGTYCWAHLWTQLQASPAEEDRLQRELKLAETS